MTKEDLNNKSGPAVQALLAEHSGKALRDLTLAQRIQISRDSIAALVADGNVTADVQTVAVSTLDGVEQLFESLQGSTTAPGVRDFNFIDKQLAQLAGALQGLRDIAIGDSKSISASNYRFRKNEHELDAVLRGFGKNDQARLRDLLASAQAAEANDDTVVDAEFEQKDGGSPSVN